MNERYLNKEMIKELLPHREPLLLVDEAEIISGVSAEGTLYLDPEWDVFRGHFPEQPVLPGIYMMEAMAQTADLVLLSSPEYQGKLPLLLGVSSMRFPRPAVPGDTLHMKAELLTITENGLADFRVSASADGKRTAAGQISIALR